MKPLVIVLDTNPLSNSGVSEALPGRKASYSQDCLRWLVACEAAGRRLVVPAIAYYEARREMERRRASVQLERLRRFCFRRPQRFLALATEDLETAARLWGVARNAGMPTAAPEALDADVILAAQALSLGLDPGEFVVATTNPDHLARFVPCDRWENLEP